MNKHHTRALTLIELLVAIILTGIIAFIVIEMIQGEHKNYSITRAKIKLQTDAREALRIMDFELRNTGYNTSLDLADRTDMKLTSCTDVSYDASGKTFKAIPGGIEFRTYNVDLSATNRKFDCSNVITIQYTFDEDQKTLFRKYNNEEKVPFLKGVESFSIKYGIYDEDATLIDKNTLASSANPFQTSTLNYEYNQSKDSLTISSWNQASEKKIWINQDIIGKLDPNATYRISFSAFSGPDFRAGIESLKAGFFTTSGSPTSATFTFFPGTSAGAGGVRQIQYDISPNPDLVENVTFGIFGSMKTSFTSSSDNLTILGIKITRLNSGKITQWLDENSTSTQWNQVKALRLELNVKDSKGQVLNFDRKVMVVNNGN